MSTTVTSEFADAIATITLNGPDEMNVLSIERARDLARAVTLAALDPEVRCVVLQGAGGNFCAGADVKWMLSKFELSDAERRFGAKQILNDLHQTTRTLRTMAKPVIASVEGAAAGGGFSIVMGCDMIVAAENAVFTMAYSNLGLCPDASGSYSLPRLVGVRKAIELAFLGEPIGAREALELGIVNRLVADAELATETAALAGRLAAGATYAYGKTKMLYYRSLASSYEEQLEAEGDAVTDCMISEDFREAVQAFVEKRPRMFVGR
ncbi:MAG TPA: enoyl-CoA hydratase-related protein [Alphaproteobacteria bacterium]|jgi:2-(1,2-epoxy-1,2-dihydrophenyl)acetyl-CoA isomerase|nr:enoyl-CoA hydratase-related protein [Alphaproteobacteria bacterium]MDP6272092.1 enoyl-CoA hydratase-related protein [Alphaproteobacteria bacterium]HJM51118.1 enoyl-CoA hydratase-related protein [Alphaproteobacteria bacterium]|tara:strand:- start:100 stop:897 length:798 start_codon:yes stop_codon:yes gene_type:complete